MSVLARQFELVSCDNELADDAEIYAILLAEFFGGDGTLTAQIRLEAFRLELNRFCCEKSVSTEYGLTLDIVILRAL
ncbi:hypothetical protein ACNSPG_18740 [Brucella pituitosa]|uniref:hypothetical protein n=1 Tax=Brucella pituitosa TaxID=571256 RepID=UPI003C7456D7